MQDRQYVFNLHLVRFLGTRTPQGTRRDRPVSRRGHAGRAGYWNRAGCPGDLLFPGISTIQTRARYFLFIPWIYKSLERRRIGYPDIRQQSRQAEVELIDALANSGEELGVIGFLFAVGFNGCRATCTGRACAPGHPTVRSLAGGVSGGASVTGFNIGSERDRGKCWRTGIS